MLFDTDFGDGAAGDLLFDSILGDEEQGLESTKSIASRSIKMMLKRRMFRIKQQDYLRNIIKEPPEPAWQYHVVSANKFDFWTWVPVMIDWIGTTDDLYCSTWSVNRSSIVDMFKIWDEGKITGTVGFLLGIYFKRRAPDVYATLVNGLLQRGGRSKAFETHAKFMLLNNAAKNVWLTIEGSANLNGNPRMEQYVITNDRSLYDFYRDVSEEMLETKTRLPWSGKGG